MSEPKEASKYTIEKNKSLYEDPGLDWEDKIDFENAQRGFIARMEDLVIRNEDGEIVWELTPYGFLENETAPSTVNPSRRQSTCRTGAIRPD